MARKRKKDPRKVPQAITPEDYGIDVARSGSAVVIAGGKKPSAVTGYSGLKLAGANVVGGVNTSTIKGPDGKPLTKPGEPLTAPAQNLAATNFMTPEEIEQAKRAPSLADQQEIDGTEDQSWVARLFDTSDTFDENGNFKSEDLALLGGEALFDGMFRGLQWGFDRLNQYSVALLSVAPGGTRTLTFDEANDVSVGQMLVANAGISAGRIRRGEATIGDALAIGLGGIPSIGAAIAGYVDPDTPVQQAGFDITDPKDREVFQNGAERFWSGTGDFGFAFADPTLVAGWGAKAARLRYVDQLIDSEEKMQQAVSRVTEGKRLLDNNLDARYGTQSVQDGAVTIERDLGDISDLNLPPEAMFLYNVVRKNADGKKEVSFEEIFNHKVIRRATARESLAVALHNADNYDEAALILRHAWGDKNAALEMMQQRPDLLTELIDAERDLVNAVLRSDPRKQQELINQYAARMDRYDEELQWMKDNLADDPALTARLDNIRQQKNRVAEKWMEASNGNISVPSQALDIELAKRRVEFLEARDANLMTALDQARTGANAGIDSALLGSTAGFSRNNRFGRIVEGGLTVGGKRVIQGRQGRARIQYETETTRGAKLWESTEFAYLNNPLGRVKRGLRVWRYLGAEAPSGIVHIAGIGAQESTREVRAMLNSIRMLGGKAQTRTVQKADGTTELVQVGGSLRKEEMLTKYANALARGGVEGQNLAAVALRDLREELVQELSLWYNFSDETLKTIMNEVDSASRKLKEDITRQKFWMEDGKEHRAPYLESQLESAEIMPNYRAIEKRVQQVQKERGSNFTTGVDAAGKWVGDSYALFQDLWRPSVLLRLGYTQRNVAEGLFRSAAFQFSLVPVGLAAKQFGYSSKNVVATAKYGREGSRGLVKKVMDAAEGSPTIEAMPKKFRDWHAAQVRQVDEELARNEQVVDFAVRQLASENETWRLAEVERLNSRARQLSAENQQLRTSIPEGMTQAQVDSIVNKNTMWLNDLYARLARISNVRGASTGPLPSDLAVVADNLEYIDTAINPMLYAQLDMLDDPMSAANLFRNQTLAKRRVFQGQGNVADPDTLRSVFMEYKSGQAFSLRDNYANTALANLSADHTTRQTMALRMTTVERLLKHQLDQTYVVRKVGEDGYWDGLATTLNQWKQSDVGQIIIKGIAEGNLSDDDIAARIASYLRADPRGREIATFITAANEAVLPKGTRFVEYGERIGKAHRDALKAAAPERKKADDAAQALRDAQREVADARKRLAKAQKTNPRRKGLYDSSGKLIRNPDAYIEKRVRAYQSAEQAYTAKVDKLSVDPGLKGSGLAPGLSLEDALSYSYEMIRRYRGLTADSPRLQTYLLGAGPITTTGDKPLAQFASTLESMIGPSARKPDGTPYQLIDVIGNAAEELGAKGFMDTWRATANLGFKYLGTIPEDTFVRAPFYGRRFQQTYDMVLDQALRQSPEGLSQRKMNAIRETAHRRALKDTKDWLYTIDRRTLLGQYGEAIFPFISASQNSVTTVGRMIWNDPRIAAIMGMIWNAPARAGIEDENGRMHFSLPLEWVPEGLRDKLGLSAMQDFTFTKQQFNLLAPPTGFGGALPIPVPGPAVVIPFSEMMKHDILGISPTAPDPLVGILGQDTADQVWETFKSYMFGSEEDFTGMSTQPFSIDKAAPAWTQKLIQFMQGEGSSSAYTSWYDKIYQSEYLKWAQGYRDEPPKPSEISEKTRNFYLMRMGLNLVAFTPPGFTSEITPIVEATQKIYDKYPDTNEANQKVYELFGPTIQQLMRVRTTEAVAGLDATADSIRLAKNHSDLIGSVAPILANNGTLNVIGMLSGTTRGEYDPSFSAAQQLATIPGTDRNFREVTNPSQAFIDSQVSAGWSQYIKNMDVINAKLAERGLKSLRAKGAEDLLALKNDMVETLRNDPRYAAWYGDYKNGVSSRTMDTVTLIQTALGDQRWREAHADDPIWGVGGAADQYMYGRDQVLEALASTDNPDVRRQIKADWQAYRFELGTRYPDWGVKQERYLSGDDDPDDPQIVLTPDVVPFEQPQFGQMGPEPTNYPSNPFGGM